MDLWLQAVPPEHTAREAEFLARALGGSSGRRAARRPVRRRPAVAGAGPRGYRLTGVDWSPEFLAHARSCDTAQRVTWEQRDMRDLPWRGRFDGAFCLGNSFGYLDDEGNAAFLRAVAAALKPGARFILETPMVLENLLGHIQDRAVVEGGRHAPARRESLRSHAAAPRDRVHVRVERPPRGAARSHRAYSYRELVELIRGCRLHGRAGSTLDAGCAHGLVHRDAQVEQAGCTRFGPHFACRSRRQLELTLIDNVKVVRPAFGAISPTKTGRRWPRCGPDAGVVARRAVREDRGTGKRSFPLSEEQV